MGQERNGVRKQMVMGERRKESINMLKQEVEGGEASLALFFLLRIAHGQKARAAILF